jgi:hypothetical protein
VVTLRLKTEENREGQRRGKKKRKTEGTKMEITEGIDKQ